MTDEPSAENDVPPPKWSDLFGIDPDFTGGMCSVCYVRWQRGAERPDEFEHAECYARVFPPGEWDEEADAMFIEKAREATRPIPPGGDPTTDHGVYRCECVTDDHEKPHTRVFPPEESDEKA